MILSIPRTCSGKLGSLGSGSVIHLGVPRDSFPTFEKFSELWPQEGALFLCLLVHLLTILIHAFRVK